MRVVRATATTYRCEGGTAACPRAFVVNASGAVQLQVSAAFQGQTSAAAIGRQCPT